MSKLQIQWKGLSTPRAKPISPELWEEHKEELCNLYQKMTLDDLMTMMKVRHSFTPSRRQYISQMERWGVQKYNKSGLDGPKAEVYTIHHNSSLIHKEHTQNMTVKSDERRLALPHHKRSAPDCRPEVPPKKRQKLSNFISEKAYEDLASAFDCMSSSEDGCQELSTPRKHNISSGPASTTSYMPKLDVIPVQTLPADDFDSRSDINSGHDLLSTPSNSVEVDTPKPRADFDSDHLNDLKLAAEFSFASNCHAEAFGMYVLILQGLESLKSDPILHEKMMIGAIIGCGCCARTPSQITVTLNILNQKLSERPVYSEDTADMFLYRYLLKNLYRKQENLVEAAFHQGLIERSTFVQNKCLSSPTPRNRALSLQLYFYLDQILSSGRIITANHLKRQLITLKPGLFEYESGHMRRNSIRACLEWCSTQFQPRSLFTSPRLDVRYRSTDMRRAEFLALFSDLWQSWRKDKTGYPSENNRIETDIGISPTVFFAVICTMIMSAAPKISSAEIKLLFGPMGPAFDRMTDIPPRALSGTKSLLGRSDWDLASAFLKAYSELNKECPPETTPEEVIWNCVVRDDVKIFLRRQLQLKIPDIPEVNQHELDVLRRVRDEDGKSTLCFNGIFETLSPSLHSATFSSLRALRDRLDLGEDAEGFDCSLPSRMMRDGSMTSILLPLSSRTESRTSLGLLTEVDMGGSALEALATVSSFVKDRLAEIEYGTSYFNSIPGYFNF